MNAAWVSSNEERLASSMTVNEATAAFFDIENIAGAAPAAFLLEYDLIRKNPRLGRDSCQRPCLTRPLEL
jgi:hypothetical protein